MATKKKLNHTRKWHFDVASCCSLPSVLSKMPLQPPVGAIKAASRRHCSIRHSFLPPRDGVTEVQHRHPQREKSEEESTFLRESPVPLLRIRPARSQTRLTRGESIRASRASEASGLSGAALFRRGTARCSAPSTIATAVA